MTDINRNKGRSAGNSDLRGPGFGNADGTPILAPPVKPINLRTQTKEVLEHLQEVQRQKKRGSPLNNPAFLGAAMKAIYDSSEVSVKRGDQTMVVTQLKGDERVAVAKAARETPTVQKKMSRIDQAAPPSTSCDRFNRPDPFAATPPPIEPIQPAVTPELPLQKTNAKSGIDDLTIKGSNSYSISDILFWISLVLIFVGLTFWISS